MWLIGDYDVLHQTSTPQVEHRVVNSQTHVFSLLSWSSMTDVLSEQ